MLDFSKMKKMIYFPTQIERRKDPRIVYVIERWGKSWKGNESAEELLANRFQFYAVLHCQPYSDKLWEQCLAWIRKREELAQEFKDMMSKGAQDDN